VNWRARLGLVRHLWRRERPLWVDYPPAPLARWGHGRPEHAAIAAVLAEGRAAYRGCLEAVLHHQERLAAIPVTGNPATGEPYWRNGYLPGLDAAVLYSLLAARDPARYVEIGSGHSTRFAARAIRDHGLRTRIHSIDPAPRAAVEGLAAEILRSRLEDIPPGELASRVGPGDILFFDGSHRVLGNSDATVFLLEVLPSLPAGVLVQIHDICLPYDYPPEWADRWYSEQYALGAFLLGGGAGVRLVCACAFAGSDPELAAILDPLWSRAELAGVERGGSSFWIETTGARPAPAPRPAAIS
jgi:hypothetical protein